MPRRPAALILGSGGHPATQAGLHGVTTIKSKALEDIERRVGGRALNVGPLTEELVREHLDSGEIRERLEMVQYVTLDITGTPSYLTQERWLQYEGPWKVLRKRQAVIEPTFRQRTDGVVRKDLFYRYFIGWEMAQENARVPSWVMGLFEREAEVDHPEDWARVGGFGDLYEDLQELEQSL